MKSSVKIRDAAILQCLQHANLMKLTKMQMYRISLIHIAKIVYIHTSHNCDLVDLTFVSHFKHVSCSDQIKP